MRKFEPKRCPNPGTWSNAGGRLDVWLIRSRQDEASGSAWGEAPDALLHHSPPFPGWNGGLTRVPFWVYRDENLLKLEQDRVFEGPVWNFLCLESDARLKTGP